MSTQSLFGYLKNYVPSEGRDPKEDYLTQMFAWILSNVDEVAKIYVKNLYDRLGQNIDIDKATISITTQESVKVGRNIGRIDLLINVGNDEAFICEHKVYSELSENQIEKYVENASQLGERNYHSVLVTYSESQWTQYSDIAMTWGDVYELFDEKIIKSELYPSESVNHFVTKEFLSYLRENDMGGYTEITPGMIQSWFSIQKLDESLKSLFSDLASEKWNEYCPNLTREEFSEYKPSYNGLRWGRLGIDFHAWGLGIFAGVILNTKDHGLEPADYEKGPDFCIFVESEYKRDGKGKERYDNNLHLEYIMERKRILQMDSGDYDYIPGLESSPWRIMVLRRPLIDVLKGAYDKKEQREALKKGIIEGINTMLGE